MQQIFLTATLVSKFTSATAHPWRQFHNTTDSQSAIVQNKVCADPFVRLARMKFRLYLPECPPYFGTGSSTKVLCMDKRINQVVITGFLLCWISLSHDGAVDLGHLIPCVSHRNYLCRVLLAQRSQDLYHVHVPLNCQHALVVVECQ